MHEPTREQLIKRATDNRLLARSIQTLLGICSGIIADHVINQTEIDYLHTWLLENPEVTDCWPGRAIAARIREILDDGMVTREEHDDLLRLLQEISGNQFNDTGSPAVEDPAMPIDSDAEIIFRDNVFCLTGRFAYGTRASCERAILRREGVVVDGVTKKVDYLVIGSMITSDWKHTTFGLKIAKAVEYRDRDEGILIISEQQWLSAMEP